MYEHCWNKAPLWLGLPCHSVHVVLPNSALGYKCPNLLFLRKCLCAFDWLLLLLCPDKLLVQWLIIHVLSSFPGRFRKGQAFSAVWSSPSISGSWGYIVSSKPWQSQGWYPKLFTLNSKAYTFELPSASVIMQAIWQCTLILLPLTISGKRCQNSLMERDAFSQIIARSESILKSLMFLS